MHYTFLQFYSKRYDETDFVHTQRIYNDQTEKIIDRVRIRALFISVLNVRTLL